jgi:hypothetical protein
VPSEQETHEASPGGNDRTQAGAQSPPSDAGPAGAWPPPLNLQELVLAADHGEASFSQTFWARVLAADPRYGRELNERSAELVPELLNAFEQRYGHIVDSRYGNSCPAGAVLLERVKGSAGETGPRAWPRLTRWVTELLAGRTPPTTDPRPNVPRAGDLDAFVQWQILHFDSQEASELLSNVLALRDRIVSFLPDPDPRQADARGIAVRRLYGIAGELTESVDSEEQYWLDALTADWSLEAGKGPLRTVRGYAPSLELSDQWEIYAYWEQHRENRPQMRFVRSLASLRARLTQVETFYLAAVQRVAQQAYLAGMMWGFLCLLVLLIGLAVTTAAIGFDRGWLATATLGAAGAVLSVLQRLGGLDLSPEGETQSFRRQGWFRPTIGALLGVVSYILLKGGLISIASPAATADKVLYFGGIAFLAGFSERFAQDMLTGTAAGGATRAGAAAGRKT